MLNGLLKSEWQHDSVEKRLQAIARMDALDVDNQAIFEVLANDDTEASVRQAAIHKLNDPLVVLGISQSHADIATRQYAESALAVLIGPKSNLSEAQFRELLAAHPEATPAVTRHCPHADLRAELVLALPATDQAELIAAIEYSDTRQLIASQLVAEEHLHSARHVLRGKDKSAEKIIKTKLDLIHAEQRRNAENRQSAETVCEKMEFLSSHDWRPELSAKYSVWSQRWASLQFTPDDDLQQRFKRASEVVSARLEQASTVEAVQRERQNIAQDMEDYCRQIASYSKQQLIDEKVALLKKLSEALDEWTKNIAAATPEPDLARQFQYAERSLLSVVEFCDGVQFDAAHAFDNTAELPKRISALRASIKALYWPTHYPALAAKAEASALLTELQSGYKDAVSSEADKLKKLHKRINRLLAVTNRGDLAKAKRELAAISKRASRYSGKEKTALEERLEKAADAVRKMSDWENFATEPKIIELCEAMEALAISKSHPDKLSGEIAKLQQRWKALGHSDSADQHWPRFKTASDQAYLPCAAHFKQRREIQRQNLKQREPLVDRMRELLEQTDWDLAPDYKKIETELQHINNAWQNIKDVERGAGQKQWQRIAKLRSAIFAKLDVVYDANIDLKNQLIKQVLALLDTELTEDSLGKLQLFQNRWKQVGITRRKQDQAVWKKFKAATDAVYEKIQDVRKAKRAKEDAQLQGYRKIIQEIKALAEQATELAVADTEFDRLASDYKALPPLPTTVPEKLTARLDTDFKRVCDAFGKARAQIKKAGSDKLMDTLRSKATLCGELEKLAADAAPAAIAKLQAAIADIEISNKDLSRRFEQRLAAALNPDRNAAGQARRLLCINLEILLGIESPAADAAMRMKLQLERMQKEGIGHIQENKGELLKQMKLDWLCLPGAEPEIQAALEQRFDAILQGVNTAAAAGTGRDAAKGAVKTASRGKAGSKRRK